MAADRILGAVDDLMFSSRIAAAAQALGARWQKVASLGDATAAAEAAQADGGRAALILIDLNWRGGDPLALVRDLRSTPAFGTTPIVAFGSHVAADRLDAARAAGCDLALPNSALSSGLPALLSRYLQKNL